MKKLFIMGFAALAVFATSCSKDTTVGGGEETGELASMTIRFVGESTPGSRAVQTGTDSAVENEEKSVKGFTAYAFNYSTGRLEGLADGVFENSEWKARLTNLNTATPKRIVAIVNKPSGFPSFAVGDNYTKFKEAAAQIHLDDQKAGEIAADGLTMYGESNGPVTVVKQEPDPMAVEVPVKRIVAKVYLKEVSVEIDPALGYDIDDLDNFSIKGVSIQRAVAKTDVYGTSNGAYYSGIFQSGQGLQEATPKAYLRDDLDLTFTAAEMEKECKNYFYVLPNSSPAANQSTLITLIGEFEGETVYFPVEIHHSTAPYVTANTFYNVRLKIKDFQGSPGPETPKGEANLDVNISVQEWLSVDQNAEW